MRTVVVGGGLSGLTAAHRLLALDPDADVTVLEASTRPGGILGTIERDGFVIETGPDSILREKPAAVELARELGLEGELIETRAAHRGAYVVAQGRLERVPSGFNLMAPTRLQPWMGAGLVSAPGRLRALLDLALPARRDPTDESLASFVRRRFGGEVLERLAQPLVGGIYGGDPDRLSLAATMPRFVAMEREAGSVIRGMRRRERQRAAEAGTGARYGLFVAFRRGMQTLVDALVERLGPRLRSEARVRGLERDRGRWRLRLDGGEATEADRVLLALPAPVSARLLEGHHRALAESLAAIPYGSAATVTFAWPREAIPHPMRAFGFVVPAVERRAVLAATFSSVKWPGRAPDGQELIRVFIGGAHGQDAVDRRDEELVALARRELRSLLGIQAAPRFAIVVRYREAMPQYHLRHRRRADLIEAWQSDLGGLRLAGNAYRGVGVPDAIAYARARADELGDA
ncbi:MAG: protoporphyrinogen oxidase [Sandaracinaceae bacterium]